MKQSNLYILVIAIAAISVLSCNSFNKLKRTRCVDESVLVGFYNVENLFDTLDHPVKLDDEFMPQSDKKYTTERYQKKLEDLNKVISVIGYGKAPHILGLCEVENEAVISDLLKENAFNNKDYGIIHQESEDFRGIDCALLYDRSKVQLQNQWFLRPEFPDEEEPYTSRDVVVAELLINNCDVVYAFVNHWPSRYGGKAKSEPRRLIVATMVKQKIDEIYQLNKDAKILLMGDFNDEPFDKSCKEIIGACLESDNMEENDMMNLFSKQADDENIGSYNYRGNWNVLDQFIVSEDFFNAKKGYMAISENADIIKEEWMLYYDEKYKYFKPSKTYGGPNYYGGYSDHLPIRLELVPAR